MKFLNQNTGCILDADDLSWQRLNLKKGGSSVQAKAARERAQSLGFIKTFVGVARPVLDAGGSVTFEWPR